MPQRRVLFLDGPHLTAYRVQGGALLREACFESGETGQWAFDAYLGQHRRSLFMMLVDIAEESFQVEDIPFSTGKDRQAILQRKFAQHFYGTPYVLGQSQGRLKTGRRDERMLLMALTQPQHLDPWVAVLLGNRALLAGIYSLAQIAEGILSPKESGQVLLLCLTSAGLRQSFFESGKLRLSRLAPLVRSTGEELALALAGEAVRMHQYLDRQRLIERDKPLTIRVLTHPNDAAMVKAHAFDNPQLHFDVVDLLDVARRVGFHPSSGNSLADELFCHLLVRDTPAEQFAPPDILGPFRLWKTRFGLHAAGALALAVALLFAALKSFEILRIRDAAEQARQETRLNREQYALKMQALPTTPYSAEDLRALTNRFAQIEQRAQGPAALLSQISQSLDAFPTIDVDRVEWSVIERIPPAIQMTAPLPVPARLPDGPYAQATVAARLPIAMVGDQRSQLTLVADFAGHLGAPPDSLVSILQQPIDTQSGKILKSGDEKGIPEPPRFVFRVFRKL